MRKSVTSIIPFPSNVTEIIFTRSSSNVSRSQSAVRPSLTTTASPVWFNGSIEKTNLGPVETPQLGRPELSRPESPHVEDVRGLDDDSLYDVLDPS